MRRITLPEKYQPSSEEKYMNPQHLEYFYRKLEKWQKEVKLKLSIILCSLKENNFNISDKNEDGILMQQATVNLKKGNRYKKLLLRIEQSMLRITRGKYGFCVKTGAKIGIERLKIRPISTLSVEAKSHDERYEI